MSMQHPEWIVRWRERDTRDVGMLVLYDATENEARSTFIENYPTREIDKISLAKKPSK